MWQVVLLGKARKNLSKLPIKTQQRIAVVLLQLKDNPLLGKKLQGELAHQYSIRVWPYRIIYQLKRKKLIILIVKIDHRQGVYK